jgi:hypothetical protein
MKNKRQWGNLKALRNIRFPLWAAFFALFALFFFAACPMEDDPDSGAGAGLDSRLIGTWRFELDDKYEEIKIHVVGVLGDSDDTFIYSDTFTGDPEKPEKFAGTIVYAERFSSSAGIIIIKYLEGRKNSWPFWGGDSNPPGDYYGIYYLNLNSAGTEVFFACTNDQNNNYGPTETETLDLAIAKFTQGNMNQLLDLETGDPQHKVGY